jgi:hypothetical protein
MIHATGYTGRRSANAVGVRARQECGRQDPEGDQMAAVERERGVLAGQLEMSWLNSLAVLLI